ncbi:g5512 [Coccomyxa viridis]|uniref:G5512 protein n=1 Tax=Coccomyxa viridis TaxID=1274662 RepID=A0ABP1FT18_9CHLO
MAAYQPRPPQRQAYRGIQVDGLQLALRQEQKATEEQGPGKAMRQATYRRTVDHTGPYVRMLLERLRNPKSLSVMPPPPTAAGALEILPPAGYISQPATGCASKFVNLSWQKVRAGINAIAWTPEGRRCLTGTNAGEFTLWQGQHFGFETILQAHTAPIRSITYTHNDRWILSTDDSGLVRLWTPRLELAQDIRFHNDSVRKVALSPNDMKFVTASDDSTLKVWDFKSMKPERTLTGHGGDVKACDWHPTKSAIASGSKDATVKLWDARAGDACLSTLELHKGPITQVQWNLNGNWLLSSSRDQQLVVFDARMMRKLAVFRGHQADVTCAAWHPWHEDLCVSGSYDGNILHWLVSHPSEPQAEIKGAHEGALLSLAWHPAGHLLASGGQDARTRFWCRDRPGDPFPNPTSHLHDQSYASESGAVDVGGSAGPLATTMSAGAIPGIGDESPRSAANSGASGSAAGFPGMGGADLMPSGPPPPGPQGGWVPPPPRGPPPGGRGSLHIRPQWRGGPRPPPRGGPGFQGYRPRGRGAPQGGRYSRLPGVPQGRGAPAPPGQPLPGGAPPGFPQQ